MPRNTRRSGRYLIGQTCECGCGEYTRGGRFLPGHDAKLKSALLARARAGDTEAQAELERRGWARTGERRFGVEIEFFGCTSNTVIEAMRAQGLECDFYGYTHRVLDTWKIVHDGSVGAEGLELVSPPLRGQVGFEALRKACEALQTAGAKVDKTCGLHVHHEAKDLTKTIALNLLTLYADRKGTIESILAASRRDNTYCRHYSTWELRDLGYNGTLRRAISGLSRYRAINLQSYPKYGTVEFRQHQGTTEFAKITAWIRFGQAMYKTAKQQTAVGTDLVGMLQDFGLQEDVAYWTRRQTYFARHAEAAD